MEILTRHILQMEILMTYLTNGNTYDISYKWKYLHDISYKWDNAQLLNTFYFNSQIYQQNHFLWILNTWKFYTNHKSSVERQIVVSVGNIKGCYNIIPSNPPWLTISFNQACFHRFCIILMVTSALFYKWHTIT